MDCPLARCVHVLPRPTQDYSSALKLAAGPAQRDIVFHAIGADAAAAGDWKTAGASARGFWRQRLPARAAKLPRYVLCPQLCSRTTDPHPLCRGVLWLAMHAAPGANWGRIVSGKPPFEELALALVESGEPEGLQAFLQTKLQVRARGRQLLACLRRHPCAACRACVAPRQPPCPVLLAAPAAFEQAAALLGAGAWPQRQGTVHDGVCLAH